MQIRSVRRRSFGLGAKLDGRDRLKPAPEPPTPRLSSATAPLQPHPLVAPQGFEPRLSESESLVLPLNERAVQDVWQPQARREPQSAASVSVRGDASMGQPPLHLSSVLLRSNLLIAIRYSE